MFYFFYIYRGLFSLCGWPCRPEGPLIFINHISQQREAGNYFNPCSTRTNSKFNSNILQGHLQISSFLLSHTHHIPILCSEMLLPSPVLCFGLIKYNKNPIQIQKLNKYNSKRSIKYQIQYQKYEIYTNIRFEYKI